MRTSLVDLAAVGVILTDQGYSELFVLTTPLVDVGVAAVVLVPGEMDWEMFIITCLLREVVDVGVLVITEDTSE